MNVDALLKKYDIPTPRYTSYPTVPYWEYTSFSTNAWLETVTQAFVRERGEISLYIHLPYCESLCTFCACNRRITKNHGVELPYLEAVKREWDFYLSAFPGKPKLKELHLGGGTPTFFSPENLTDLIQYITSKAEIPADHEFSIEVHPNYTTEQHLIALSSVGFNRISLGVQDFDPEVQFLINRIQSFEQTKQVVDWARKHGFSSINIDLVYGLPHQKISSILQTMDAIASLLPDRIAYYSYAHVPWKSKGQRRYTEVDLPAAEVKHEMYQTGKQHLEELGFTAIGMDHFARNNDGLLSAWKAGKMHRNFMGYTTTETTLLIGLGASSISDSWGGFAQNEKEVEPYLERISKGEFPICNGHILTEEDEAIRTAILDLMCRGQAVIPAEIPIEMEEIMLEKIHQLEADELLTLNGSTVQMTAAGNLFVRIAAAAMDARLWRKSPAANTFSKAI